MVFSNKIIQEGSSSSDEASLKSGKKAGEAEEKESAKKDVAVRKSGKKGKKVEEVARMSGMTVTFQRYKRRNINDKIHYI